MGGGRPGEMIFSDPPGSYGSMNSFEKMQFETSMSQLAERRHERERVAAQAVLSRTVELEGEKDD